jgi:hypothetical protein
MSGGTSQAQRGGRRRPRKSDASDKEAANATEKATDKTEKKDKAAPNARRDVPNKRVTAKKSSGRYTPPIPRSERHSPRWFPWMILGLLFLGVAMTILNYLDVLPSSPSDWYTVGGIVAILAGVLSATFYR